jgi:dTDP-4-dehydrorhamnose 3,5-epimerase
MIFEELHLKGAFSIKPTSFEDHRGFFARWFCEGEFSKNGLNTKFVQCNHSGTTGAGSLRGMHFQYAPDAEVKMIKCIVGKIFDVIVDLRKDSPTFLQWVGVELSETNKEMLYVPKGFAHGFQSLTERSEIIYMVSDFYNRGSEGGVRFDDKAIGIKWPLAPDKISDKDLAIPLLDIQNFEGVRL